MKLAIVAINSAKTVKGNQLREIDSGGGHCIFIESRSSQIISVHLRSSQFISDHLSSSQIISNDLIAPPAGYEICNRALQLSFTTELYN
jgi:hypothetical protein